MMKPLYRSSDRAVTRQDFDGGDARQSSAPYLPQANLETTLVLTIAQRVFVVDDDPLVRASLCAILTEWPVEAFADATSFLRDGNPRYGDCLIADIQMPQMSGIELQHVLNTRGVTLPVIVLSGQADVPLAVEAMKAGAFEFIQKPFDASTVQASVTRALEWADVQRLRHEKKDAALRLLERLTERERDVFNYLTDGYANKVVAYQLGISPRTVEVHRARILEKLDASCLADLVRIAQDAELRGTNQAPQTKI
ncbi:MAG: response regulator transcription factor [Rhizomicrobium sp.]